MFGRLRFMSKAETRFLQQDGRQRVPGTREGDGGLHL